MADRDNILSKLEALMKRTRENGASEAEVEAAMAVARRLMDEHNIQMEELLAKQKMDGSPSSIEIKEEQARVSAKMDRFEKYLMHTASYICDVKWYYKTVRRFDPEDQKVKKQIQLIFYGMGHDVFAAKLLFLELLVVVRAMARVKVGKQWTQRHYYYCDGFCAGLMSKAQALKAKSNRAAVSSTSLILVKDHAIAKYGEEVLCLHTGKSRPMDSSRYFSKEYSEGYQDGNEYDINPKRERKIENPTKRLT